MSDSEGDASDREPHQQGSDAESEEEEPLVAAPRRGAGKGFLMRRPPASPGSENGSGDEEGEGKEPGKRDSDEEGDGDGEGEGGEGGGEGERGEEEGEGDDVGFVDSSEEEEGDDEYEKDDFLVDEDDDEGGEEDDDAEAKKRKKRKKKRKKDKKRRRMALDDDDYDLLEDNTGVKLKRPQQMRRIARKGGDEDELPDEENDERTVAQRLQEDLFGDGEDLDEEDEDLGDDDGGPGGRTGGRRSEDGADDDEDLDDDEDGLDDFIVDGDDADGEQPGGVRRKKKKKKRMGNISSQALQEAQDIFGDVDGFLQRFREMKNRSSGRDEEDLGEEGDELDLSDEEEAENIRMARLERKEQRRLKMAREQIEPDLLAKYGLTDADEALRKADIPERMVREPVDLTENQLDEAATWVYENLFGADSRRSEARDLVEDGRREVDMPPTDGRDKWDEHDLEGRLTDIRGLRGVCRERDNRSNWHKNFTAQENLKACIREVLKCFYIAKEEVPLVAMYRKELCGELLCCRKSDLPMWTTKEELNEQRSKDSDAYFPEGSVQAKHRRLRRWDVLWAVWETSKTFAKLVKRRQARTAAYEAAIESATSEQESEAIMGCLSALAEATAPEVYDDVEEQFRMVTLESSESGAREGTGRKAPKKTSPYVLAKRAGIGAIVPALGLNAAQFGENLQQGFKKNEPEDHKIQPAELVETYGITDAGFEDPLRVMAAAQQMAAVEIAADPVVRQHVRRLMTDACRVSTQPTKRGEEVLDPFHPYGRVKRIRDKPLERFEGSSQFVAIKAAEDEGLLMCLIEVPERELSRILDRLKELFLSEGVSTICQSWNQIREKVLRDAVVNRLWPTIRREARLQLEGDAQQELLVGYSSALWQLASAPPLQVRLPDEDEYVEELLVMAVCWGPGGSRRDAGPPSVAVMLDADGHMVDFINLPQLSGQGPRSGFEQEGYNMFIDPRKERDAHRVRDFVKQHAPHVIIIGASGPESRQLKTAMEAVRGNILDTDPEFMTRMETGTIDVRFAPDSVAKLWAATPEAAEEISEQGDQIRRAVGLGRSVIEPLAVLASLCGPGQEVLSLPLHPLQKAVSNAAKMRMIDQVMITAVNQVGVDLNLVAQCSWMAPKLQFVSGLGPRKATALLSAVARQPGGYVESRMQVFKKLGVMEKTVFINCGPFLRIRKAGQGMTNLNLDCMDDTRIHPLNYKWAIKIAQDALSGQERVGRRGEDEEAMAVENAMEKPNGVLQLDMWDAADKLREKEGLNEEVISRLIDIQYELVRPYAEIRGEAHPPTDEEVFEMLTSDGCENGLIKGRMVEATVGFIKDEEVEMQLEGGIPGRLGRGDVSSSRNPEDIRLRDLMTRGQTLRCRILGVDARAFAVHLTCASKALQDDWQWEKLYCADKDEHYVLLTAEERKAMEEAARGAGAKKDVKKGLIARPIRHERYRTMTQAEAAADLRESEVGDYIFRPSTRGPEFLGLSVVIHSGGPRTGHIVQHLQIAEGTKAGSGPASRLQLGKWLVIKSNNAQPKNEKYEDLDEVVARFIEPLVGNIKALTSSAKFKEGAVPDVDAMISAEYNKTRRPVYGFGIWLEEPGKFYLAYQYNQSVHHDFITPTNQGYVFRSKDYTSLDKLADDFKRNPVDPSRKAPTHSAPHMQSGMPYGGAAQQQHHSSSSSARGHGTSGSGYPPQMSTGGGAGAAGGYGGSRALPPPPGPPGIRSLGGVVPPGPPGMSGGAGDRPRSSGAPPLGTPWGSAHQRPPPPPQQQQQQPPHHHGSAPRLGNPWASRGR